MIVRTHKPQSLRSQEMAGLRRFIRSRGSTDREYDDARRALEKANEARLAKTAVTLPPLKWLKP